MQRNRYGNNGSVLLKKKCDLFSICVGRLRLCCFVVFDVKSYIFPVLLVVTVCSYVLLKKCDLFSICVGGLRLCCFVVFDVYSYIFPVLLVVTVCSYVLLKKSDLFSICVGLGWWIEAMLFCYVNVEVTSYLYYQL